MILRNPISQIRQNRIMGGSPMRGGSSIVPQQSPIKGGMGGFRGLFSQPTPPVSAGINFDIGGDVPDPPSATGPNDRASQFYNELKRLQSEAGPGVTAYRQALGGMPTPDQYKPNWMTRIASGLSGFSAGMRDAGKGIETAQYLNQSGYRNAMEDYSNRLGTLKEQATIEEASKRSSIDALESAWKMNLDYDKYEQQKIKDQALIEQGAVTAGARRTSAEAAAKRASMQDYTYTPVQGGFMVQNKNNPDDPLTGKIIPGRTLQDAQLKVSQQNAGSTASQAATSAGRLAMDKELEPRRVGAQEANAGANVWGALHPRETGQNNVFMTPAAQDSARDLAMKEMQDDPAWSRFFGTQWGGWSSTPKGPGDFDPDDWQDFQEELKERSEAIMNRQRGGVR